MGGGIAPSIKDLSNPHQYNPGFGTNADVQDHFYPPRSTVVTNLLADAFSAWDSFRITLRVGDLSPRSSWLMFLR